MGFQKSYYEELPVEDVMLDSSNPRIAIYLEIYKDEITSKEIALALNDGMPYGVLKDSIKANEGITNPIVVNKTQDGKYVVIEGNTRLQIYKDFLEDDMPGEWETIKAIVYENLDENQIHAIRLQAHLVGPRSWDP